MKIIQFQAENVKRLKVVQIRPTGNVVMITGANGEGKSSVIDTIYYTLAGSAGLPSQPIRTGEDHAFGRLDLGEFVVTRKFTPSGTTLTVEAANGARFASPQKLLDGLLGTLSFDPLAFSRMAPKQQLETLRSMVKLDVDIDALDKATKQIYEARTGTHKDLKRLEAQRAACSGWPEGTPSEPIDTGAIVRQMHEAGKHNSDIEIERAKRKAEDILLDRARRTMVDKIAAANQMLNEAANEEKFLLQQQAAYALRPPLAEPIVADELKQQFDTAQQTNKHVEALLTAAKYQREINLYKDQADAQTAIITANEKLKADTIASAEMPVPGLSFGEGEVLFDWLPLSQASGAEQLRISVRIAMAANPKLRVLLIKDGGAMDSKALAELEAVAALNDYQVWIEKVDETGKVGIVMVDGAVAAENV